MLVRSSEPVLSNLETCHGDQIQTRFLMGELVKYIHNFYDSYTDIGGDAERSNL